MPNWCSNALGVTGPAEDIASFVEAIKNPDGTPEDENEWDLTRPHPLPAALQGTRAPALSVKDVEAKIAELKARRAAGELQAHRKHEEYPNSWVTDKYLQDMRDAAEKSVKAKKETGYEDWYEWCCHNWGTKWPPHVANVVDTEDTAVMMTFDTAWAPPSELIEKLSKLWPTLQFVLEYSEPGMGFLGATAYKGGFEVAAQYVNSVSDDDPYMKALNDAMSALYAEDDDPDGNLESDLQDQINERWMRLQERAGADVSEALKV